MEERLNIDQAIRHLRELQIGLSHALDAAVLERQPQVVEVWLAMEARTVTGNTTLSSPGSIVVIHGVAKLDTDVIVWSRADNDDLLARVLSSGGRLIIRIHCGHLLDHERRPFSSSLDGVLGSQSPHAPGGVHETWMFVRGG